MSHLNGVWPLCVCIYTVITIWEPCHASLTHRWDYYLGYLSCVLVSVTHSTIGERWYHLRIPNLKQVALPWRKDWIPSYYSGKLSPGWQACHCKQSKIFAHTTIQSLHASHKPLPFGVGTLSVLSFHLSNLFRFDTALYLIIIDLISSTPFDLIHASHLILFVIFSGHRNLCGMQSQ